MIVKILVALKLNNSKNVQYITYFAYGKVTEYIFLCECFSSSNFMKTFCLLLD